MSKTVIAIFRTPDHQLYYRRYTTSNIEITNTNWVVLLQFIIRTRHQSNANDIFVFVEILFSRLRCQNNVITQVKIAANYGTNRYILIVTYGHRCSLLVRCPDVSVVPQFTEHEKLAVVF